MKFATKFFVTAFALGLLAAMTAHAQGQFVYTNNGTAPGVPIGPCCGTKFPNTVSAYSAADDGSLTEIAGSPFYTGGQAIRWPQGFQNNRIIVGPAHKFLYVANVGSNDVSVFKIDPISGSLAAVAGSPFATQGNGNNGIVLQATPDETLLFAANRASTDISVFSIGQSGSLALLGPPISLGTSVTKPNGLASIKVSPDGRFLAAALPTYANNALDPNDFGAVAMFRIDSDGSLTPVPGSPFADTTAGGAGGIDISCGGNLLFAADTDLTGPLPPMVDVFWITRDGTLTPRYSVTLPVTYAARGSAVPLLSADDGELFVSNYESDNVTAFSVAWDGALSLVPGSPFAAGGVGVQPAGMAVNRLGTQLYAAMFGVGLPAAAVASFNIGPNGALTSAPGSPLSTGLIRGLMSVAVYPAKTCVMIDIKPGDEDSVINPRNNGTTPVAILSSAAFNARSVDASTLTFGRTGLEPSLSFCNANEEDVNADSKPDIVCQFRTQATGLSDGDDGAILKGRTIDGAPFAARDWIRITP